MKVLFVLAFAALAVAAPSHEVVDGGRSIISGPSGIIDSHTGTIARTPFSHHRYAEPIAPAAHTSISAYHAALPLHHGYAEHIAPVAHTAISAYHTALPLHHAALPLHHGYAAHIAPTAHTAISAYHSALPLHRAALPLHHAALPLHHAAAEVLPLTHHLRADLPIAYDNGLYGHHRGFHHYF